METNQPALVARLFPEVSLKRNIIIVMAGALLTAICAQASIPAWPVPITLQTLAVTLCGLTMGSRLAIWSQLVYISAGCCGLPIFANFSGGIANLAGPTGGYLVAFVVAAGFLGYAAERGRAENALDITSLLIAANFVILALGTAWLAFFVPKGTAMAYGFYPFIGGAVIKSIVVAGLLPAANRLVTLKE
jgi:biotin transport system substrate-specific component